MVIITDIPCLVVAGTRTFDDYPLLSAWLDAIRGFCGNVVIMSSATPDADRLAEKYAKRNEIPVKLYPANWKAHGRAADPIRKQQMCELTDALLVF